MHSVTNYIANISNVGLTDRANKKRKYSKFQNHEKSCLTNSHVKAGKRLLFQGIQFLLTGFSRQKEKDLEGQIWKHGGVVLFDIPSPNSREKRTFISIGYQLPIILCSKKVGFFLFLANKINELIKILFSTCPLSFLVCFALFWCFNGFHVIILLSPWVIDIDSFFVIYVLLYSSSFFILLFSSFGTSRYIILLITERYV